MFLKKPIDTQEMLQHGPWHLRIAGTLLVEKMLIAKESDPTKPALMVKLSCHIASLAIVFHKPSPSLLECKVGLKRMLSVRAGDGDRDQENTMMPELGGLVVELCVMDIGGAATAIQTGIAGVPAPHILGGAPREGVWPLSPRH